MEEKFERKLQEELSKILIKLESYIEETDYPQAIKTKKEIVNQAKNEYMYTILNVIGIKSVNILNYVTGIFDEISMEIQQIIEERKNKHIEEKTQILETEFQKNLDETSDIRKNYNNANAEIEETQTQIDYLEKIRQIIKEKVNDSINQTTRELEYIGASQTKITEIAEMLFSKRDELLNYSLRLSEKLEDLDKSITEYVKEIHEESIQEILKEKEKEEQSQEDGFRGSIKVNNSDNSIEENAIKTIEKQEEQKQQSGLLNPNEIFGNEQSENSTDNGHLLDADDIF